MRLEVEETEIGDLFETLTDKSPVGVYIVQDGKFCYVNPAFCSCIGYGKNELVGKDSSGFVFPEDREMVRENAMKMLKGELTSAYQFRVIDKMGSIRWVMESVSFIRYRGRRATVGNQVDITDRKRMEEALQDTEDRYRALFDGSLECVYVHDFQGNFRDANDAALKLLGYEREDMLQLSFASLLSRDQLPTALAALQEVKETGTQKQVAEFRLRCKDGSFVDVETISALVYHEGKPCAIQGFARDVTERKRTEEELRESEARFRTVVELAPYGMSLIAKDGKYEYVNPKFTKIFGYSLQDIPNGKEWFRQAYPDPEYRRRVISTWLEDLETHGVGETRPRTFTVTCKDRTERMIEFRPVSLADGRQLVSHVDITDQERLQDELRKSEAKFIDLYENASDIIFTIDVQGRFTSVNRAALAATGYSSQEILGLAISDIVSAASAGFWSAKLQKAVDLKSDLAHEQPWEVEAITKDGRKVLLEIRARLTWEGEHVVGVQAIARDITERKKMEEALRNSEEKLRKMFGSVIDGIVVIDLRGVIDEINQGMVEMHGFSSSDELRGKNAFDLVAPHDRERIAASMKKAIQGEAIRDVECTLLRADGSEFPAEVSTSALKDTRGNPVGHITIVKDITERKRQAVRLMMADRLASVGELAAGAAHELNNPLTSVIGFSQLLMERDVPDDIREELNLICSEAQRAADVVRNLLTFARKHAPVKQPNQINRVIEDVLKLRAYEHRVSNVEVMRRLDPALPEVMVDYFQMQQVFLNIIMNAEYFLTNVHDRGTLTVTTRRRNSCVVVSVADDGPGISQENMNRVFDPFFTTKETGKGTGLGLSICHGIVTEHGGQIYARSQPGEGATFFVELPVNSV